MGSKGLFGVLLIGLGILGAYLAITGQLQAVWTLLTTGQTPVNTPNTSAASANTATPTPITSTTPIAPSPVIPQTPSTTASQIQNALNDIQSLENYQPVSTLPSSATTTASAPISTLPSVYSTTLAQQSGVTGVLS